MKITTWNVNSINARLEHLLTFLKKNQSDIILLQELKCINELFPYQQKAAQSIRAIVYAPQYKMGWVTLCCQNPVSWFSFPMQVIFYSGRISIYLQMMPNMTSSAPPPIDCKRPSR